MAAPSTSEPRINNQIRAREVRLVGADGEQIGIVPLPDALSRAQQAGLDLVEVADKANPPVCKIMDHGKAVYEAKQRDKASRKKSTTVQVKEMKYRPKIGKGDFDTKTRKVKQFLDEGNRVKITIMFRGREVQHPELGRKILDQVAEATDDVGKVEVYPKLDGPRNMVMVMVPDREKQQAAAKAAQAASEPATAASPTSAAPAPARSETPKPQPVEAPAAEAPPAEPPAPAPKVFRVDSMTEKSTDDSGESS